MIYTARSIEEDFFALERVRLVIFCPENQKFEHSYREHWQHPLQDEQTVGELVQRVASVVGPQVQFMIPSPIVTTKVHLAKHQSLGALRHFYQPTATKAAPAGQRFSGGFFRGRGH